MEKSFSINLEGKVKNFNLPINKPLIPLFEAIVNSINAIDERKKNTTDRITGKITVKVIYSSQGTLNFEEERPIITGFEITDNGCGFNDANLKSFLESDSTYKAEIGGKGIGRFSWLKAFHKATISSTFYDSTTKKFLKRDFEFSLNKPTLSYDTVESSPENDYCTTIRLVNYYKRWQSEVPIQIDTIAKKIIRHCFVYFLSPECPQIFIIGDGEKISLNTVFKDSFKIEKELLTFNIKDSEFNLLNVKIQDESFGENKLYLCANNRLVQSKSLGNIIVDLNKEFFDSNKFWYVGVLRSQYLDEHVDLNRLSFTIQEKPDDEEKLFNEITLKEILTSSSTIIENFLKSYLAPIEAEKLQRIQRHVAKVSPQYRPLVTYMAAEIKNIRPGLSEEKLDDELYKINRKFEKQIKKDNMEILSSFDKNTSANLEEYELKIQEQIEKLTEANSANLAKYITHRSVILKLFEKGLRRQDDGTFNKERFMHNLIYPMKKTSNDIGYESHNLWLIDDRLSYYSYISSDIPFDNDKNRPDILLLDNPVAVSDINNDGKPFDNITIFELKRPMRNDYTNSDNPIEQLFNYVDKIKENKAFDKNGRIIKVDATTKFYLYVVCDITSSLEKILKRNNYKKTSDLLGYSYYNEEYNAYIEILSYDKILNDSQKRNHIFFEKLGII